MATGKNLPGTIRVTSDGNFKVLTPNNKWVGADTMREAMDAMKNAWGPNVGPRVLPPKRGMKSGGTVSRKRGGKIMQGYKAGGRV